MTYTGTITLVETTMAGSTLVEDAVAGASSITVQTLADFDLAGGKVVLTDETVPSVQIIDYLSGDIVTGVLELDGVLASDFAAGTDVTIDPDAPTTTAYVATNDDDQPLPAIVAQELRASYYNAFREGTRDGDGASVIVEEAGDQEWRVVTVIGEPADIDGGAISPDTTVPPAALTDGLPPDASPTTTVAPFAIGSVRASWPAQANADPVMYDVYASLTSPVTTADELVTSTSGLSAVISRLGGGQIPMTEPGTDVYVAVVARDADGTAEIGAEGSGAPRLADNEFISALYAYFGEIEVNQLTSGVINALTQIGVGSSIVISEPSVGVTPLTGGIVVLDPANPSGEPLVRLHPEGCTFRGQVTTDILTVLQDLVINGAASLSSGGTLTLKNGVSNPPTGPVLTQGALNTIAWPSLPAGHGRRGICWDAGGGQWIEMLTRTSDKASLYRTVSTSGTAGSLVAFAASITGLGLTGASFTRINSVTVLGSSIYTVAVYTLSGGYEWSVLHKSLLSTGAREAEVIIGSAAAPGVDQVFGAVGNDGTNVYTYHNNAYVGSSNQEIVKRDATTLASAGTSSLTGFTDKLVKFIAVGDRGYGASKLTIGYEDQVEVYALPAFLGAAVAKDTALSWTMDASVANGGLAYKTSGADQGFYSNHSDGKLWRWSTYYPAASEQFWVKYQDTGAGAVHTESSPVTSIAVGKRRFATVTLRAAPSGVTGADVWAGYGSSTPATYYKRSETLTARAMVLTSLKDTSGSTTVPAGNTFGGSPAILQSEAGGLEAKGDGSFKAPKQDQRIIPTLANGTGIGEVIVAQWALPAGYLIDDVMYQILMLADVSSTATLTWRIRCGTAGTTADATVKTFTTTAAGAANVLATNDFKLACLADGVSGLLAAAGHVMLGNAIVGPTTGGGAGVSVDTTAALKLSVTLTQSASQTTTVRAATLNRLRG